MIIDWSRQLSVEPFEGEEFRPVVNFEKELEFSNHYRLWRRKDNKILTPHLKGGCRSCYSINSNIRRALYEYELIWQYHNRKALKPNEVIHHKDFNSLNNNIDNLEIMDRGDHAKLHRKREQFINWIVTGNSLASIPEQDRQYQAVTGNS